MGQDMARLARMLDTPVVRIPDAQRQHAVMNVVWMNRDDPALIGDMLDALGLMEDAKKLRAST